jgi:hypothetical protein
MTAQMVRFSASNWITGGGIEATKLGEFFRTSAFSLRSGDSVSD